MLPKPDKPPNRYANEFASGHEECQDATSLSRCWQAVAREAGPVIFRSGTFSLSNDQLFLN
jgi:hypothetical protein